MIKADTPNLWEIRNHTDHATAIAILVTALIHLSRLVNLPKENSLNRDQIGELANDIIEEYGYLKVEEVKYILKQALRKNKIYGRLDYGVVIKWFEDYVAIRAEHCVDISSQEETQIANQQHVAPNAISWESYVDHLWDLAMYADPCAVERLSEMLDATHPVPKTMSEDESRQAEIRFKKYFYTQYLKRKQ